MQCIELSSAELDLVLLGALQSHMNLSCNKVFKYVRKHSCLSTALENHDWKT